MQELIRMLRTLYLISKNSEKHEVVIDEDTLKIMLDTLKKRQRNNLNNTFTHHYTL